MWEKDQITKKKFLINWKEKNIDSNNEFSIVPQKKKEKKYSSDSPEMNKDNKSSYSDYDEIKTLKPVIFKKKIS